MDCLLNFMLLMFSGVMAWMNICISVDVRVYANVELIRLLLSVCFKLVQFNLNVHVIIWFWLSLWTYLSDECNLLRSLA